MRGTSHDAPRYVIFSTLVSLTPVSGPDFFFPPFRSKFLLQHPFLLLLQLVFFSVRRMYSILLQCEKARHDFGIVGVIGGVKVTFILRYRV